MARFGSARMVGSGTGRRDVRPVSDAALERAMAGREARLPADRVVTPPVTLPAVAAPVLPPAPAPAQRPRRSVDPIAAARNLPRGDVSEFQRSFRHWFSRTISATVMKTYFRLELTGREHIPAGPAVYCFNHL